MFAGLGRLFFAVSDRPELLMKGLNTIAFALTTLIYLRLIKLLGPRGSDWFQRSKRWDRPDCSDCRAGRRSYRQHRLEDVLLPKPVSTRAGNQPDGRSARISAEPPVFSQKDRGAQRFLRYLASPRQLRSKRAASSAPGRSVARVCRSSCRTCSANHTSRDASSPSRASDC